MSRIRNTFQSSGSGSIYPVVWFGSAGPDPYQNVTDPEYCFETISGKVKRDQVSVLNSIWTLKKTNRAQKVEKIFCCCCVGSVRNWQHITDQIGMFCFTGMTPAQVIYSFFLGVPLTSACSTCQREKVKAVVNPQLIPKHKHRNKLCGRILLYSSLTELPSLEIKWALQMWVS